MLKIWRPSFRITFTVTLALGSMLSLQATPSSDTLQESELMTIIYNDLLSDRSARTLAQRERYLNEIKTLTKLIDQTTDPHTQTLLAPQKIFFEQKRAKYQELFKYYSDCLQLQQILSLLSDESDEHGYSLNLAAMSCDLNNIEFDADHRPLARLDLEKVVVPYNYPGSNLTPHIQKSIAQIFGFSNLTPQQQHDALISKHHELKYFWKQWYDRYDTLTNKVHLCSGIVSFFTLQLLHTERKFIDFYHQSRHAYLTKLTRLQKELSFMDQIADAFQTEIKILRRRGLIC